MNFVGLSIPFQVEVSEKNPSPDSDIVPEEGPNHPHSEQTRVVLYSRPSGIVVGKQAGMVQDAQRKALETVECHVPEEWKKGKNQFRRPAIPNMQADDLEDIGILVARFMTKRSSRKAVQSGYPSLSNFVVVPYSFILINCR